MKGIFIVTLALCLGACASQPEKTVAADPLAGQSTDQTQPPDTADTPSSGTVYLDDFERVPAPPKVRQVRVLGKNKG